MATDLGVVLLASAWFFNCFKHTGRGGNAGLNPLDTEELGRCAAAQTVAFDKLADDLIIWFPEGSNLHETAQHCAARLRNVANGLCTFVGNVTAWYDTHCACDALSASVSQLTIGGSPFITPTGFIHYNLSQLHSAKSYEVNVLFNSMREQYPWIMHAFVPDLVEDSDTE